MCEKNPIQIPPETLNEIYDDGLKPAVAETGKIIGRIPRAINAAFAPLDQWIEKRNYNVEKTKIELNKKLRHLEASKIVPPEPYVAIPALESISYCMDSEKLRNLYANLLANAINIDTKNSVHPAFVRIIEQLSPLDALFIDTIFCERVLHIPVAQLRIRQQSAPRKFPFPSEIIWFDDYILNTPLDAIYNLNPSIENLSRLGIIRINMQNNLSPHVLYDYVTKSKLYNSDRVQKHLTEQDSGKINSLEIVKGYIALTEFGKIFYDICVKDPC